MTRQGGYVTGTFKCIEVFACSPFGDDTRPGGDTRPGAAAVVGTGVTVPA